MGKKNKASPLLKFIKKNLKQLILL